MKLFLALNFFSGLNCFAATPNECLDGNFAAAKRFSINTEALQIKPAPSSSLRRLARPKGSELFVKLLQPKKLRP